MNVRKPKQANWENSKILAFVKQMEVHVETPRKSMIILVLQVIIKIIKRCLQKTRPHKDCQ
jgi:hypothetical protein